MCYIFIWHVNINYLVVPDQKFPAKIIEFFCCCNGNRPWNWTRSWSECQFAENVYINFRFFYWNLQPNDFQFIHWYFNHHKKNYIKSVHTRQKTKQMWILELNRIQRSWWVIKITTNALFMWTIITFWNTKYNTTAYTKRHFYCFYHPSNKPESKYICLE